MIEEIAKRLYVLWSEALKTDSVVDYGTLWDEKVSSTPEGDRWRAVAEGLAK